MGIKSGNGARRHRGRSNNRRGSGGGGSGINQLFDSSGPEARVKGTAPQVQEKYENLARDASSGGDRIAAENFLQHAEHYLRLYANLTANQPQNTNGLNPKNSLNNTSNTENNEKSSKNDVNEEKIPTPETTTNTVKKDELESDISTSNK